VIRGTSVKREKVTICLAINPLETNSFNDKCSDAVPLASGEKEKTSEELKVKEGQGGRKR